MSDEGDFFHMGEDGPHRFERRPFSSEKDLEDYLEAHPQTISDLMIVGRQVPTDGHGDADLVAIDCEGRLWAIELKKLSATRKITEQIHGYLSWGLSMRRGGLKAVYANYAEGASLSDAFEQRFGKSLPSPADMEFVAAVVAYKFDEHANCQFHTMRHYGYPIRGFEYSVYYCDGIQAFSIREVRFPSHDERDGF